MSSFDAARCAWLPSDEARPCEGQHHLVNRGRADTEVLLHVGFGRRPAVQTHVQVDKRQYWPCLGVKIFARRLTPAIRFDCSSVPHHEEAGMNLRYRVRTEPMRTRPTDRPAKRRQASRAMSSSLASASTASRICARLSLRAACRSCGLSRRLRFSMPAAMRSTARVKSSALTASAPRRCRRR